MKVWELRKKRRAIEKYVEKHTSAENRLKEALSDSYFCTEFDKRATLVKNYREMYSAIRNEKVPFTNEYVCEQLVIAYRDFAKENIKKFRKCFKQLSLRHLFEDAESDFFYALRMQCLKE